MDIGAADGVVRLAVITLRNVSFEYPGGHRALEDVTLEVGEGERVALIGPNGAGKSTLLHIMAALEFPRVGEVRVMGQRVDRRSAAEARRKVGFLFQDPDDQVFMPSVYEDVAFGPLNMGLPEEEVRRRVEGALEASGAAHLARRVPQNLSLGEKKRVAIAGVLAMDPDVLVFDEPTSSLDPSGSEDIMELLDELNQEGKTIVISTHDVELAYPWAHRAILLTDGRILQEDVPDIAFGNPELIRMAHLSMPTLLEIANELKKRGFPVPDQKPRSVLDMVQLIESSAGRSSEDSAPGTITVCNVDRDRIDSLPAWVDAHAPLAIGAMGTRAKQCAAQEGLELEFTYGVIDKCILRALRGRNSLILTTGSMAGRVSVRVEAYCRESGITIPVHPFDTNGETDNFPPPDGGG